MSKLINLTTVNAILSEISLLRDDGQDQFLKHVIEIIHTYVDIYFLKFFLLDPESEWVIFRVGTSSEATAIMLSKGYRLKVTTAVFVGKIVLTSEHRLTYSLPTEPPYSLDIHFEADQGLNYVSPLLPKERSMLFLPLRFQGKLVGAWHISSSEFDGFELDDIVYLQLLADQLTVRLSLLSRERSQSLQSETAP